jgi:hypothetical protein
MPEWAVSAEFHRRIASDFISASKEGNVRDDALRVAGEILFEDKVFEKSLADLFAVSRQAMAIRLLDLGLVREVSG